MGQNRYLQDNQQLRQQDHSARKCKQPDQFKFRVGGRIRGVPLIVRFNYRIRQHEGDQAYKNHDLESFVGHDRVDRTTQPSGIQVAWLYAQGRRILVFQLVCLPRLNFFVVAIQAQFQPAHLGLKSHGFRTGASVITVRYLSAPFHAPGPQSIPPGQLQA